MKRFYAFFLLLFIISCSHLRASNCFFIKNSQNEKIYVKIDGLQNIPFHKLVFIQHGLAANLDHQVVQTIKKAFLDSNYVVVTFDSRYSLGHSGDNVQKARIATFEDDLKNVINWAKTQSFYIEPFALSGHSMGGYTVLKYSADNNTKVNLLIPVAPVISGDLWEKSCMQNMTSFCQDWKKTGFYEYTERKTNKTAIIPYAIITDSKNENAYNFASKIKANTLLISAQNDIVINSKDVHKLEKFIDNTNFSTISSSGHNFESEQNQTDLYNTIKQFLP